MKNTMQNQKDVEAVKGVQQKAIPAYKGDLTPTEIKLLKHIQMKSKVGAKIIALLREEVE